MTVVYDFIVLIMTLLSVVMISMIVITAKRHETAWCIFFGTAQLADIAIFVYAVRKAVKE